MNVSCQLLVQFFEFFIFLFSSHRQLKKIVSMGCGMSNDVVSDVHQVSNNLSPSPREVIEEEKQQLQTIEYHTLPAMSSGNRLTYTRKKLNISHLFQRP